MLEAGKAGGIRERKERRGRVKKSGGMLSVRVSGEGVSGQVERRGRRGILFLSFAKKKKGSNYEIGTNNL